MKKVNMARIVVIVLNFTMLVLCCIGCGKKVAIDTESIYVYKYCTADTIISEFMEDSKDATDKYRGEYVLLSGKIVGMGKKGKNMVLSGTTATYMEIECSYNKKLRKIAREYSIGENVALYGKIKVDPIDKDVKLEVMKIVEVPAAITSTDMYYLLDGTSFDRANAAEMTFSRGGVEYYIPRSWTNEEIQHNIVDEKLGLLEGHQYMLNKLDEDDEVAESLFVCYFDNKTQLSDYLNDSDKVELIEKAIVENILGKVGDFPSKEVTTYYGDDYTYYLGTFKSVLDAGDGYHTEFIFKENGEDGIAVVLYLYKETEHLSDVMFVLRFLEIE